MLKRWKQLKPRERLIFLMLFTVLLPTLVLLATQYYSLRDLREKTEFAFENSLRQTIERVDDNLETKLSEIGFANLQAFDEKSLEPWNGESVQAQLTQILRDNPNVESAFALSSVSDALSYTAIADRAAGYREVKSDNNPGHALFSSPEEESLTVSFVAVTQSPASNRAAFFFVQDRCEKCSADEKTNDGKKNDGKTNGEKTSAEKFYIYRPISDPRDIMRLRFVGISLKRDYVAGELLPQALAAAGGGDEQQAGAMMFGVYDENRAPVYSSRADGQNPLNFEVQSPLRKTFNRWTLAASYRDDRIEDLSQTYFRRNLLLLILMMSLLVVGILLILRVTAKEVELAAAKSAFVSNVSHELKTPLSLIRLFAETLETGRVKSPEKAQEYYRIISSETKRLTQLINNILDFAAIEAGRKEYKFESQNLTAVVKEVVDNYKYVLDNAGFEIRTDYDEKLPPVPLDRDAISQAVLNLLNNACKYSADEKFVEIKTERRRGAQAAIVVTDHGIGISPNEQDKIFEKFYRSGGSADVHNAKGSGLGLSLVRHIAEAHHGRVTVSSVLRRGSTFTIVLPLKTNGSNAEPDENANEKL